MATPFLKRVFIATVILVGAIHITACSESSEPIKWVIKNWTPIKPGLEDPESDDVSLVGKDMSILYEEFNQGTYGEKCVDDLFKCLSNTRLQPLCAKNSTNSYRFRSFCEMNYANCKEEEKKSKDKFEFIREFACLYNETQKRNSTDEINKDI